MAIDKDLAVLSSSSATEQERLGSLKYLGHWVGDVHQPLHVSFEDDRGGNSIGVSGGLCSWNLHAVWDRCIIEQGFPGDPYTLARQLLRDVTNADRATWRASTPIDWANESFAISVSPEIQYCVGTDTGCWYGAGNERLDQAESKKIVVVDRSHIEMNIPTVRDRLVKAGVRLGSFPEPGASVNSAFAGVSAGGDFTKKVDLVLYARRRGQNLPGGRDDGAKLPATVMAGSGGAQRFGAADVGAAF